MAKYSFSLFTLTAAASAVDESFIRRVAGTQAINCERKGRHARNEQSCLSHTECAWVEQCQAAPSRCTGNDFPNCMDDSSCEWVGPNSDNGYCEIVNSCGSTACKRTCENEPLCEWAEGCESNDYMLGRSDCGSEPETRRITEQEQRDRNCKRHRRQSSCDGDYANECTWIGDDATIGVCGSQAAPTPSPYPCGMLYSRSACNSHEDSCEWDGQTCNMLVNPPVKQVCGMYYSSSSCPSGCNWTGTKCQEGPVTPCGMLYEAGVCNHYEHCAWDYNTDLCENKSAHVDQPCGMIYDNEACYKHDWCHWDGSTCKDGAADVVDCAKYDTASKCFNEYHWTRDYSRNRFTHVEACDWHYLLDKCLDA